MSVFPRKYSKTQSSLNFLQSGPRRFTKSDFSGLAPIGRVLTKVGQKCRKSYIFDLLLTFPSGPTSDLVLTYFAVFEARRPVRSTGVS